MYGVSKINIEPSLMMISVQEGALAVGDGDYVGPHHLLFYKEFFPTLGIVVERYAVNVESFGAELLERLLQIGQFAAAGT